MYDTFMKRFLETSSKLIYNVIKFSFALHLFLNEKNV